MLSITDGGGDHSFMEGKFSLLSIITQARSVAFYLILYVFYFYWKSEMFGLIQVTLILILIKQTFDRQYITLDIVLFSVSRHS